VPNEESETLARGIFNALLHSRDGDTCWTDLVKYLAHPVRKVPGGITPQHPLIEVARQARHSERGSLGHRAWETFEKASALRGVLLGYLPESQLTLPAFDLAASLLGEGALGNAAQLVIFANGSSGFLCEIGWWRALLRGLRNWSRWEGAQSADDRFDIALALIVSSLGELKTRDRGAFWQALESEDQAYPEWGLPAEFGVRFL
jgi:hypothetical protein